MVLHPKFLDVIKCRLIVERVCSIPVLLTFSKTLLLSRIRQTCIWNCKVHCTNIRKIWYLWRQMHSPGSWADYFFLVINRNHLLVRVVTGPSFNGLNHNLVLLPDVSLLGDGFSSHEIPVSFCDSSSRVTACHGDLPPPSVLDIASPQTAAEHQTDKLTARCPAVVGLEWCCPLIRFPRITKVNFQIFWAHEELTRNNLPLTDKPWLFCRPCRFSPLMVDSVLRSGPGWTIQERSWLVVVELIGLVLGLIAGCCGGVCVASTEPVQRLKFPRGNCPVEVAIVTRVTCQSISRWLHYTKYSHFYK